MADPLTVVITGASSGIGRATAAELATRGHRVVAVARREPALIALAERFGPIVEPVPADVTDSASVAVLRDHVLSFTGGRGPDAVVNSAGIAVAGPVEAVTDEATRRQFETNVFGLLEVTRAFLPEMRERRRGRIVNISSFVGRMALPTLGVYSASKHAVEGLSDALRAELRPFGVRVSLVEPTFTQTELFGVSARIDGTEAGRLAPYAPLLDGVAAAQGKNVDGAVDPQRVAGIVVRAVTAKRPRDRYVVPGSARLLMGFLSAIPAALSDRALARTVGLGARL